MTRAGRIANVVSLVALAAVVLYAIVWGLTLRSRLEALDRMPGISLEPEPYALVPVPKKQKIDLGYATISLPVGVPVDVFEVSSNGAVVIEPHKRPPTGAPAPPGLYLNLPRPNEDRSLRGLADLLAGRSGVQLHDSFEMETKIVSSRPFTVWSIPGMGLRNAKATGLLLAMKGMLLANANSVGAGRAGQVGFIAITYPWGTSLLIADRRSNALQKIAIFSAPEDARAIVSAVVGDYDLHLASFDEEAIKRQIKSAHIRPMY